MTRNEAREIMMQVMYEMDASKTLDEDNASAKGAEIIADRMSGGHVERCGNLLEKIIENMAEIDAVINECSTKWKTTRMPKVDLAIMRLAIGEIKYSDDVPEAVAINEAINLAKKYSTDGSAKFIHGVLGAASKALK